MRPRLVITILLISLLLIGAATALAQSGGGYDLTWNTADSGSGTVSGGGYSLSGTIGQPEAGAVSGGGYALVGGFWAVSAGVIPVTGGYPIYLPLILK